MTDKTRGEHQKTLNGMVSEYEAQVSALEQKLVDYALEHDLYLSLGDYGAGRSLLTRKDFEDSQENGELSHWSGKELGDWVYSSESC